MMTNNTALSAFEQVALQKQVEELQAKLAMQDEALQRRRAADKYCAQYAHLTESEEDRAQACQDADEMMDKAISATSEDVAAWKEKQLAPVQREVAVLHAALDAAIPEDALNQDEMGGCVFCDKAIGKHGYGYATNDPKDHEEDCAWIVGKRVLHDTKATAKAYEEKIRTETKIETLEDLAIDIGLDVVGKFCYPIDCINHCNELAEALRNQTGE